MSENRLTSIIASRAALSRRWHRLTADKRRRVLALAGGSDARLADIIEAVAKERA